MFHALTNMPNVFRPPAVCGPFAVKGMVGPPNLAPSQDFGTGWTRSLTVTSTGQPDPDGGSSAVALLATGTSVASAVVAINPSPVAAAQPLTFSVTLKAGTSPWARLSDGTSANWQSYFDITTGVLGTSSGSATGAQIVSLGGGWFRISISATSVGTVRITSASADGVGTSTLTNGVAWVTAYNPALTSP